MRNLKCMKMTTRGGEECSFHLLPWYCSCRVSAPLSLSHTHTHTLLCISGFTPPLSVLSSFPCILLALVSSGCYNKAPLTEWLINKRSLFLTVLEAGSGRSRHLQIWGPVRGCFLVHRLSFCCVLT